MVRVILGYGVSLSTRGESRSLYFIPPAEFELFISFLAPPPL